MAKIYKACLFGAAFFLLGCHSAQAQQTIFNVPSPEVTEKGKLFLQHESQFRGWNPGAFWLGTHYAAVGVGHNTELDLTLFNVRAPFDGAPALSPGFKSYIPLFKERFPKGDYRVVVGSLIPIALGSGSVGTWSYATLAGRVPVLNTRISGGVSFGTKQIFGDDRVAAIITYEQPITKRFSLIGDWFSGTHTNANFIPGFSLLLPGQVNLYCGYQIPNNKQSGRSGFVVEVARTFKAWD